MSTGVLKESIAGAPAYKGRLAGAFYLLTFVTGLLSAALVGGPSTYAAAASLAATACYLVVTVLFYYMFRPVSRNLALLAAFVSLVGCVVGTLSVFHLAPFNVNSLVFFGFYCLLIGYLIFASAFLPRVLGGLMALAGLGWLTFVSPAFASHLFPFNVVPGLIGEGSLTLWLLLVGVNAQRWREQAGTNGLPSRGRAH